jgi:hypothetical protein
MRLAKITRKQVDQVLKENPIHEVLNVAKSALTPKQLKYCENVAKGDSKAGAYRKAYNSKAKPDTQANEGYKLSKRPDIDTMTEAIRKGLEWERSYTLAQTRALVVERLTKEALDEDSSPSARINALKALGTVAGVDAFIHRTETTVIKDSAKIRDDLMTQLKAAMQANTIDIDAEADELLAEIAPPKRKPDTATPLHPDPTFLKNDPPQSLHSNPDKRIPSDDKQSPSENISQQNHTLPEQVSTLTVDLPAEEGVGGTKKHPDWEELSTGNTPVSGFKTKG